MGAVGTVPYSTPVLTDPDSNHAKTFLTLVSTIPRYRYLPEQIQTDKIEFYIGRPTIWLTFLLPDLYVKFLIEPKSAAPSRIFSTVPVRTIPPEFSVPQEIFLPPEILVPPEFSVPP